MSGPPRQNEFGSETLINLNDKAEYREIRIFVSSTFRDMMEERDYLVKKVFPKLRKFCQTRSVELTDVDLRWGVTEEQAEQGKVIEICLREIDRCRPYFIGILGERYGWVPEPSEYKKHRRIVENFPWVKEDMESGLSITEMEIQYGVLRKPEMESRAYFYIRKTASTSPEYREKPGSKEAKKLEQLKSIITSQNTYPCNEYSGIHELGEQITKDFESFIDAEFPERKKPSYIERNRMDHAAFARSRLKVYKGGEKYIELLDKHVAGTGKPLVVSGEAGWGKSALLANWIAHYQKEHPDNLVLYHFIGGAPDSTNHIGLMRRIMEEIKEAFGLDDDIPIDQKIIAEAFPLFLSKTPHEQRWVLVLDALNQLEDKGNARWLGWLPEYIPENIRVIISTLSGEALENLRKRGYPEIEIEPLAIEERKRLIKEYLNFYTKELSEDLILKIAKAPQTENPLILRTILDELRIFGIHEELKDRVDYYLAPKDPVELFNAVLNRLEEDYENEHPGLVGEVFSLIWASRRGLAEGDLFDIIKIPPLFWAPLYNAIESHLVTRSGLMDFFHDFLRQAVERRYLSLGDDKKATHAKLSKYFETNRFSDRGLDELPYHLLNAEKWEQLKEFLTDLRVFALMSTEEKKYELTAYWQILGDRYDMAQAYIESLAAFEKTSPSEELLTWYLNLVAVFLKLNAVTDKTEALFRQALSIREKALGTFHPETAKSLDNLASLMVAKGDYDKAEHLYTRALEIFKRTLGPQHREVAVNLHSLASLLLTKGDYNAAEPLCRQAIEIREKALGPHHLDTAKSLDNLASILHAKGDYDAAEPLYRQAIDIFEKALGPHHPDTAITLSNLASLFQAKKDYDAAEPLYMRALKIRKKALGPHHPERLEA